VLLATTAAHAETVSYAFERGTLNFTHVERQPGGLAVGTNDPALRSLLATLGATLTWRPGDRAVLIATAAPDVVSFGVGDAQYGIGSLTAQARFAPYASGSEVYLPFDDLMRALGVAPANGVLERMLTAVDVEGYGAQAVLVARGGGVLHPRAVVDAPDRLVYEFDGVGTTLAPQRTVNAGGIRTLTITSSGTSRDPKTTVTLDLQPGTRHDAPQSGSGEFEVAFGANGGAPPLVAPLRDSHVAYVETPATPPPPPADMVTAAPQTTPMVAASTDTPAAVAAAIASVGAVSVQSAGEGGLNVVIPVNGNASYEWHRLRAPDNRFWIDFKGAQLAGPPVDQGETNPLTSLRVRQIDPQTVRVALSFSDENSVSVSPSGNGISITVGTDLVADTAPRSGTGSIGAVVSASEPQTLVTPVPAEDYGENGGDDQGIWKFGPRGYVPTNPRLIVLDPGHGGVDRGSIHGGLEEAVLTLDMAKRVQSILLARGYEVRMTRTIDHDVDATPMSQANAEKYGFHNGDAYDLQARDDIANEAGARLFVSIHCNAFINSGPSGVTIYYSKNSDQGLAHAMDRNLRMADLGVKDDGTVKSHLYVTMHAAMPAILIETAFLSNPNDYAKLSSSDWRQQIAQAIADGIVQYAQANPVAANAPQQ
jgi:N-acetylmuramoyl-L-alanine amidase